MKERLTSRRPKAADSIEATQAVRSFRTFLESPSFCSLELSPLIAAIADASCGLTPDTIDDAVAERHFGCARDALPTKPVRTVVTRAGGRGGKTSRLLGPKALHGAWTVPVPLLARGEEAYAIIVAPSIKLARQALSFCKGYVDASPVLAGAKRGESLDHISLERPDGTRVRVEVFAAGRGGAQLRAKTLVFAGFDEASFFRDESTGIVNDAELYRAVLPRIVPGGQAWLVTTPWLADVGLVEEFLAADFGKHDHALCAIAPTRALNPNWDPTGEIEADLRAHDPEAADREIDAKPMVGGSATFFAKPAIDAAVNEKRPLALQVRAGCTYGAGGDLAFRRNSSALAIVERREQVYQLAMLDELKPEPGLPLKVSGVVDSFAKTLQEYSVDAITVDSHERADAQLELARYQISASPAPEGQGGKAEAYILVRKLLHEGRIGLPNHARFLRQLRGVRGKPMPGGGMAITSPQTVDGSHGDLVSAFVNAVWAAVHLDPSQRTSRGGKRR